MDNFDVIAILFLMCLHIVIMALAIVTVNTFIFGKELMKP